MLKIRFLILLFFAVQVSAQISDFEHIDFKKADSIALSYKDASLINLNELSNNLTHNLDSKVEKFRAIYMWVCTNVANDYRLYSRNMNKRYRFRNDSIKLNNWNEKFKKIAFQKLLQRKTTICTGYAYILKELSNLAGIDCRVVHGYAKTSTVDFEKLDTPNHSWNVVKLENKWYLCDPTWASGSQDPHTGRFEFNFIEGYFLSNPKLFALNHYPLNNEWLLLNNTAYTYDDFILAPILYTKSYTYLNNHILPLKLENSIKKYEKQLFKYELKENIDKIDFRFVLDNGIKSRKINPDTIIDNNTIEFSYVFNNTGFYDLHFYINDAIIATYTFDVSKINP